jgi:hypothetical protein
MSDAHTGTPEHTHFGLTEMEMRNKTGSNGNFEGLKPLCGNGSFHCHVTRNVAAVTCEACKARLATRPAYLSKV